MQKVYLLEDISREDREMVSLAFKNYDDAKKEFDKRIQAHFDCFGLTKEDFNNDCEWWSCMELSEEEMYDWEHSIQISFYSLDLE